MAKKKAKKSNRVKKRTKKTVEEHAAEVGKTPSTKDLSLRDFINSREKELVSTTCVNCNLRLIIPKKESNRCILCGCKELNKIPYAETK